MFSSYKEHFALKYSTSHCDVIIAVQLFVTSVSQNFGLKIRVIKFVYGNQPKISTVT